MAAAPPVIELRGVAKTFVTKGRALAALADVSFSVAPGEFIAIVGPSGCGKSTLLNLIAGLGGAVTGQVLYRGAPVQTVNTGVGYVTQDDNLLPWKTAAGNVGVALGLRIRRMPPGERSRRVRAYLDKMNLTGFEHYYPAELSGGMRKRVALARALVYDPETLLMDEPFGALDAQLKLVLQDELLRIWEATRKTVVFVTHDLSEALILADRVVVLTGRPGRVKLIREVDLPRPRDAFQVRFTEHFGRLHRELWDALKAEVRKGEDV
ncbi:MAG: ABC transporter ATP-binding protein [Candidatus Rokubacteria bacterium]|nr:ABC transporter ATP-binding protein [Candidatus Rokubacteria bacterium]